MAARPGRFLLAAMRDERPDTPQQLAERIRRRDICDQIAKEREARYPRVTAENAREVLDWQDARLRELIGGEMA